MVVDDAGCECLVDSHPASFWSSVQADSPLPLSSGVRGYLGNLFGVPEGL